MLQFIAYGSADNRLVDPDFGIASVAHVDVDPWLLWTVQQYRVAALRRV